MRYSFPLHRAGAGILPGTKPKPPEALQTLPGCSSVKFRWSKGSGRRAPAIRNNLRSVWQDRLGAFQAVVGEAGPVWRVFQRQPLGPARLTSFRNKNSQPVDHTPHVQQTVESVVELHLPARHLETTTTRQSVVPGGDLVVSAPLAPFPKLHRPMPHSLA